MSECRGRAAYAWRSSSRHGAPTETTHGRDMRMLGSKVCVRTNGSRAARNLSAG